MQLAFQCAWNLFGACMKHAQVQWETETGERSEKTGKRRKKGRRLIRRIPGRSGSAFYFCSVIKKRINEKERDTRGPMLSQLTSWGKVCCSFAAWEGARSGHSITLTGFFFFLHAFGSVYHPKLSKKPLFPLIHEVFPLSFTFSWICRLMGSGAACKIYNYAL